MKVADYLDHFKSLSYPALFGEGVTKALSNIEAGFGDVNTREVIYETALSSDERSLDFSVRVDTTAMPFHEYWLEFDAESFMEAVPENPCRFVDSGQVRPETAAENEIFYAEALPFLCPGQEGDRFKALLPMLRRVVSALAGRSNGLFQAGAMNDRNEEDRLRIFTLELPPEEAVPYLKELSYGGDTAHLQAVITALSPFLENDEMILDFDIFPDHISEKAGINFGIKDFSAEGLQDFLNAMALQGMCLPEKIPAAVSWFDAGASFIRYDISHFKYSVATDRKDLLKAYFRQQEIPSVIIPKW